jgi:hypothetical protein
MVDEGKGPNQNINANGIPPTSAVGQPPPLTKSELAALLLSAATAAAKRSKASAERECMRQSMMAIVMASAAMEACANEIITVILDRSTVILHDGSKVLTPDLCDLKNLRDSKNDLLSKMKEMAKRLGTNGGIDMGGARYQALGTLLKLRNALVHFRPGREAADQIKGAVPKCSSYHNAVDFPFDRLCYPTAKWAVETVLAASKHFSCVIKEPDRFEAKDFDFTVS